MHRIDLVEKLAELQRQFADVHRHVRSLDQYRVRHARRHPELSVKRFCQSPQHDPNLVA